MESAHTGGDQPDEPLGFDVDAELALFLRPQPSQDTLRALFEYAQNVVYDSMPADEPAHLEPRTLHGSRNPTWGSIIQLGIQVHEFSPADPETNFRHVATITSSEVVDDALVGRTRQLWWGSNGDFFEVRGDTCDETDARALVQGMWPDIDGTAA